MQQKKVLGGLFVAVLAFATFGLALGGAALPCTPSTCTGPVYATFSYSNCSGTPIFYQVNSQFGVCDDGYINEIDQHGLTSYQFLSDSVTCDRTASNASYSFEFMRWGACQPSIKRSIQGRSYAAEVAAMYQSFIYLANVNASYVSPQDFDNQPLPAYVNDFAECYSVDNCTEDGQAAIVYETLYDQYGTCVDAYRSYYTPQSSIGVCLNFYNQTYYKSGCFDGKGFFSAFFADAACTKPTQVSGVRYSCTGSSKELHCNAPITPIPFSDPETPAPSSASSAQVSAIVVLISLIVGFINL